VFGSCSHTRCVSVFTRSVVVLCVPDSLCVSVSECVTTEREGRGREGGRKRGRERGQETGRETGREGGRGRERNGGSGREREREGEGKGESVRDQTLNPKPQLGTPRDAVA